MIQNYSDHAANERTFLSWVRTAIAIMAFGFVVEKFDLFLVVAAGQMTSRKLNLPVTGFSKFAGIAFIFLGTAMTLIAAWRFVLTARAIDKREVVPGTGSRIDIALALLLALLGLGMLVYMARGFVMPLG
jgi:putative membrane protein